MKNPKKRLFLLFVLFSCLSVSAEAVEWKMLFDGSSLQGWKRLGGQADYRAEAGAIVGSSRPQTANSFLCTERTYGDFILELELKVDPSLNSGVQIRSNSLPNYHDGHVFGYQVEIDPSNRAYSGGVYDEARRGWLDDLKQNEPAGKAFSINEWNKYRIKAAGDSVRTWVNDVPAADLVDSMTLSGFFGLQVHSTRSEQPLKIRWRNIRIKELGRHMWKPLFDGRSLNGWHTLPGGKWEIRDGVIVGSNSKDDKRHGLLISDKCYGDFTARLKFKSVKGNSGFYFRTEKVDGPVAVHGFQAEVDPIDNVAGLYETGGRGWVAKPDPEVLKKAFRPQQWNEMTVSAHGRHIVVHLNGRKTVELKNDPSRLQGHLALQLHGSDDVEVMYKDIEMMVPVDEDAVRASSGEALDMPLLFETDFEDGSLDYWQATDPAVWRIEETLGGKSLALTGLSKYEPDVRSPLSINLIRDVVAGSFVLELKLLSTGEDTGHRDLCLFFGHQDPSHFYYVHLGKRADKASNSIFIVDGKPRLSIAKNRTSGTNWDDNWHDVRLVRDVRSGKIELYFDNLNEPAMTAVDGTFKWGRAGIGSFDNTGRFDNIRLWGRWQ